jgi:hypothetical protein
MSTLVGRFLPNCNYFFELLFQIAMSETQESPDMFAEESPSLSSISQQPSGSLSDPSQDSGTLYSASQQPSGNLSDPSQDSGTLYSASQQPSGNLSDPSQDSGSRSSGANTSEYEEPLSSPHDYFSPQQEVYHKIYFL